MKAAVCERYGPPDVIRVSEIEKPIPKVNEVMVRVRSASINPLDCGTLTGRPYAIRLMTGLTKPQRTRLGVDFAGVVEVCGRHVEHFDPGDAVFGLCLDDPAAAGVAAWLHTQGAFSDYITVPESALALKPANLRFEQAAAVPVAALTALQGLRDAGHLEPHQSVLINGAAGGVGTFAVQLAKAFGAEVTGVCSAASAELVLALGAQRVIDYAQRDFTRSGQRYHMIFDCVGNHSLGAYRRALMPRGICVMAGQLGGAGMMSVAGRMLAALAFSRMSRQRFVTFLAKPCCDDLKLIAELLKQGTIKPVIDKSYGLSDLAEAIRHLKTKHARGKVVIGMEPAGEPMEGATAAAAAATSQQQGSQ